MFPDAFQMHSDEEIILRLEEEMEDLVDAVNKGEEGEVRDLVGVDAVNHLLGSSSEASLANLGKLFTPGFEKLIIVSPKAMWEIIMIALTPMPFMLRPFHGSLSNFQLRWHCWSPR